ncbi:unnamed protein product, partial [marine sediment metagenome]
MITTDSLRKILELEGQKGYTDKAVIGGLDKYLHKQAGQIRQGVNNRQLLAEFDELNLANSNYGSCDVDERKKCVMRLFDWLSKLEEIKQRNKSGARALDKPPVVTVTSRPGKRSEGLNSPITIIK